MPKQLTLGNVRGVQQIADLFGIFAMFATDHSGLAVPCLSMKLCKCYSVLDKSLVTSEEELSYG